MVRQSHTLQSTSPDISGPTWHHSQLLQYYQLRSLCCTLHPHDYSVTTNLYFLIPSPFSPVPQPSSHLSNIKMFSVSMSLFLFCLFVCVFLDSTYKWNHLGHLSSPIWLTPLSKISSMSILVGVDGKISFFFFNDWVIFTYICTTSFLFFTFVRTNILGNVHVSVVWEANLLALRDHWSTTRYLYGWGRGEVSNIPPQTGGLSQTAMIWNWSLDFRIIKAATKQQDLWDWLLTHGNSQLPRTLK